MKSNISKRDEQILTATKNVLRGLEHLHNDLERFVESQGLFIQRVDSLPENIDAALYHDMIALKKNESPATERLYILHELGHFFLHSMCIGYHQVDNILVIKQEKEAETFASLVLYPSVDGYETEKEFLAISGLPKHTAKLRINFFRRTGI